MRSFIIFLISCLVSLISISSNAQSRFIHPDPPTLQPNVIIPPSWAFGVLYGGYTNQAETIKRITDIQKHDYPIDAYWIDSWFWSFADSGRGPEKYIDFVADTVAYPNREKMWDFMQRNDIKGGFWIWNVILKTGNEKAYDAFKKRGYFSRIFLDKDTWHNKSSSTDMYQRGRDNAGTWCGVIDFKKPAAVRFFDEKMKHFFDEGADFV
ncbi:MAG TPA: TIM-barrel domain-containing protein, partial [Balneolales bacterium]|nr:TIM-barrel domain-containing protein [Balneolales bacterium]